MKIKEVILYSSNIEAQIKFYDKILELPVFDKSESHCSLKVGNSMLTFKFSKRPSHYHFAFNIPSNQIVEAHSWLKKRVDLLNYEGEEIVPFNSWNAKGIYFYDADNNIVELIARNNLRNESSLNFSSKSILNISEIGMATESISNTYNELNKRNEIAVYSGDFNRFCAVGNEEGLFILVNPNKKNWSPTNEKILISDFTIKGDFNFDYKNGKIM